MTSKRITFGVIGATLLFATGAAQAQYAPVPQKSPRTPVSKELVAGRVTPAPVSRVLDGRATVLDSERLRINDVEVRLFGVVPPQLGASFGPQARAVVDALAQSAVTCHVKDREKSGPLLATCRNASNADFGIELLRRGLAATARGSLRSSDLAAPYLAAEQAAQGQRLGIWSTSLPAAASERSIREAAQKALEAKVEAARQEAAAAAEAEKQLAEAEAQVEQEQIATPSLQISASEITAPVSSPVLKLTATAIPTPTPNPNDAQMLLGSPLTQSAYEMGFFERYQLLFAGLLLVVTSVIIVTGAFVIKRRQTKEDLRSVAAAIRGELMAARSVCQGRLSKIAHDGIEKNISWPRIRVIVFQAYVGRLGCLGSDLSRQIASIYGMASDYASFYNTVEPRSEAATKRQALEALVQYIEEVVPRLSLIEKDGVVPQSPKAVSFTSVIAGPEKPLSISSSMPPSDPSGGGTRKPIRLGDDTRTPSSPDMAGDISKAKAEIMSESQAMRDKGKASAKATAKLQEAKAQVKNKTEKEPSKSAMPSWRSGASPSPSKTTTTTSTTAPLSKTAEAKTTLSARQQSAKIQDAAQSALKSVAALNLKAPIMEQLSKLKGYAASHLELDRPQLDPTLSDFSIPDYANLTEEELEALLYTEEETLMTSPLGKTRQAG